MGINAVWMKFKEELIYKNRFVDTTEVKHILDSLFRTYCEEITLNKGTLLYRARRIDNSDMNLKGPDFYGFDNKHSLAPPRESTSDGRLNCSKLPILYLADDEYTALAEVRPAKKSKVSIATIKLDRDVKLLKFNFFENTKVADEEAKSIIIDIKFLLYYPVMDDYKEQYLPTQFIASYVKEKNYDGIYYSSSQSNKGNNIGLFDLEVAHAVESRVYLIQSLLFYAEEILPRRENTFLIPTSMKGKYDRHQIQAFLDEFKE